MQFPEKLAFYKYSTACPLCPPRAVCCVTCPLLPLESSGKVIPVLIREEEPESPGLDNMLVSFSFSISYINEGQTLRLTNESHLQVIVLD